MSIFDTFSSFSFAGIKFPVEDFEVEGGLRDHVHEYSHQDGGDPELLGMKLYSIRATGNFQDTFKAYPGLFPNGLNRLTQLWEEGTISELTVPSLPTSIRAYAVGWTRRFTAKIRSGVKVPIHFRQASLPGNPITIAGPSPVAAVSTASESLAAALADSAAGFTKTDLGLFEQLQQLSNELDAIKDTTNLYGNLVSAKLTQMIAISKQIDGLAAMQDPRKFPVVDALHNVWFQCGQYLQDQQSQNQLLAEYITPVQMSIQGVSIAIYRDTSRVPQLLQLNSGAFEDPAAIPANTPITYYAPQTNSVSPLHPIPNV